MAIVGYKACVECRGQSAIHKDGGSITAKCTATKDVIAEAHVEHKRLGTPEREWPKVCGHVEQVK